MTVDTGQGQKDRASGRDCMYIGLVGSGQAGRKQPSCSGRSKLHSLWRGKEGGVLGNGSSVK